MANSSEAGSQVEAAWCLNNLSAGTNSQAKVVIDAAGQALVDGLNSGNVPLEVLFAPDTIIIDPSL